MGTLLATCWSWSYFLFHHLFFSVTTGLQGPNYRVSNISFGLFIITVIFLFTFSTLLASIAWNHAWLCSCLCVYILLILILTFHVPCIYAPSIKKLTRKRKVGWIGWEKKNRSTISHLWSFHWTLEIFQCKYSMFLKWLWDLFNKYFPIQRLSAATSYMHAEVQEWYKKTLRNQFHSNNPSTHG